MGHGVEGRTIPASIDRGTAREIAETMQALATPSRVRILGRLRQGACSVGELADAAGMAQPAVSQQLRMLRHLGLVVGHRQGRQVIYTLHDDHVAALLDEAAYHIQHLRLGIRGTDEQPAAG
jgi:DNA-binding transcriptional ArsR family regulator